MCLVFECLHAETKYIFIFPIIRIFFSIKAFLLLLCVHLPTLYPLYIPVVMITHDFHVSCAGNGSLHLPFYDMYTLHVTCLPKTNLLMLIISSGKYVSNYNNVRVFICVSCVIILFFV